MLLIIMIIRDSSGRPGGAETHLRMNLNISPSLLDMQATHGSDMFAARTIRQPKTEKKGQAFNAAHLRTAKT